MEIKELRELNIRIATTVMGWHRWYPEKADCYSESPNTFFAVWGEAIAVAVYEPKDKGDVSFYFSPSTDISAAWQIVERLKSFTITRHLNGQWTCWHWDKVHHRGVAGTAPLAICLASLAALQGKDFW